MGDEFDQYQRQAGSETDQDEFAQFRRDRTHGNFSTAITPETRAALAHTQTGTGTTAGARERQISSDSFFTPLVSPKTILNSTAHFISAPAAVPPVAGHPGSANPMDDDTYARWRQSPNFFKQAATSTADVASGLTSPSSLTMAGAGGLTALAPEVGLLTKPAMAAAGAGFGIKGGKDIYDVTLGEERNRPMPERLEKGFLGGAQIAGGAAGLGETSLRGTFSRGMDNVIPNETFTPRELFDTAAAHGIDLDLADATGHGLPVMAKKGVEFSLGGSMPFIRKQRANVAALEQWNQDAGARIRAALENDYATRKTAATNQFQDLDRRVGPNTIDGTLTVEDEAIKIRDQFRGYYQAHPELVPKKAWAIVNDLAERPKVGVKGQERPAPAHTFSWSELHQLRSDLMDVYRNNPEMIKSREQAWLQQMVKTIDDTMTGAASHLSPADQAQFRQANASWEDLKSTYDKRGHPLYNAVRAEHDSQIPALLSKQKAPEFRRTLQTVLGPEYVEARQLGRVNEIASANPNPSGSARMAVPATELGTHIGFGMHSGGATLPYSAGSVFGEYGLGKLMNSPRVTRFLTDTERAPALPRGLMIAAPSAAGGDEDVYRHAREFMRRRPVEMAGP